MSVMLLAASLLACSDEKAVDTDTNDSEKASESATDTFESRLYFTAKQKGRRYRPFVLLGNRDSFSAHNAKLRLDAPLLCASVSRFADNSPDCLRSLRSNPVYTSQQNKKDGDTVLLFYWGIGIRTQAHGIVQPTPLLTCVRKSYSASVITRGSSAHLAENAPKWKSRTAYAVLLFHSGE